MVYDYQFDAQSKMIKGAKGRGPAWLRDLLGPDYFDTVVYVRVTSAKGMEGVNGLARLRSLSIDVPEDGEDPMEHLQDIDGLEELDLSGYVTDIGLDHVRGLKHLRRLTLSMGVDSGGPVMRIRIIGSGLAGLQSCPALRELTIENSELSATALGQIGALSHLEKLAMFDVISNPRLVVDVSQLTALRDFELSNLYVVTNDRTTNNFLLIVGGIETTENLTRLEKLTLSPASLSNSNVKYLCKLRALRDLDLSGCTKIDNRAVPYLQKMTGLRKLTLVETAITDEGAERIDDALPDCRVIYGSRR